MKRLASSTFVLLCPLALVGRDDPPSVAERTQEVVALLRSKQAPDRLKGCRQAEKLGDASSDVVPTLVALLKDETDRTVLQGAVQALARIQKPALGPVLAELKNAPIEKPGMPGRNRIRALTLRVLEEMHPEKLGQDGSAIIAVLSDRLDKGDVGGLLVLAAFGPDGKKAIPYLIQNLKETSNEGEFGKRESADSLARIGPLSIPAIVEAFPDMPMWGKMHTMEAALLKLHAHAAPAVPTLLRVRMDDDPQLRRRADQVLRRIGRAGVPQLIQALSDTEPYLRGEAMTYLNEAGVDALKEGLPQLQRLLTDEDPFTRMCAAQLLKRTTPD